MNTGIVRICEMKIILTRHGETVGNLKNILEGGRMQGKLSRLGLRQVKKLALRLRKEKFDYVYSSDLKRAKETAGAIMKYHPDTPVKFVKDLREQDLGDFTEKHHDSVDWSKKPKNFETRKHIQKRAMKFIDRIYRKHKNQTVLLVAHSIFNKALLTGVLGKHTDLMDEIDQKNTCVNIIEIREDKKHVVHLMNCIKHLD
jgi:broad specificity phosphatase PhoE